MSNVQALFRTLAFETATASLFFPILTLQSSLARKHFKFTVSAQIGNHSLCAVWSKRPTILPARASLHIEVGLVAPQIRFSAADMTPLMGKRQAQEKHKDLRNVKNDKETYSHIWNLNPNPNLLKQTIFTIRKTWDAILRKEGVVLWRSKKPSFWTAPV